MAPAVERMSPPKTRKIRHVVLGAAAITLLLAASVLVRRPLAQTLFQKGNESAAVWKHDDALRFYAWALRIHYLDGEPELAFAHTLFQKGEIKQSFEAFTAIAAKTPDSKIKARAQNGIGRNLFNMSRPDEAIQNHQDSLDFARKTNDKKLEAESLIGLSRVLYHAKGRFDEAKSLLEKALVIGRETKDERIIADSLRNIGVVLWWGKGELERPLNDYYLPALDLYRKLGDRKSEATMLSNIGHIHSFQSDAYEFMNFQQQSLQIREEIGDLAGLSESYTALGSAYLLVRNLSKASEYFEKSIAISRRTGFLLTQNEAQTHLAAVYVETERYDEALAILEELYNREKSSPGQAASRLGSMGYCYLRKGEIPKAKATIEKLLDLTSTDSLNDPQTKFAANVLLGEIYLRSGEIEKAETALSNSATVRSKHRLLIQGQFSYSITNAELEIEKGNPAAAIARLMEAADDELDLFAVSGTNQTTVPVSRDYERLLTLLIEQLPLLLDETTVTNELVFRFLEQRRYRTIRNFVFGSGAQKPNQEQSEDEVAALQEIQRISSESNSAGQFQRLKSAYSRYENAIVRSSFDDPKRAALLISKPATTSSVRSSLDGKTALVEYLFVGQKAYALTIRQTGLRIHALPVSKSNLRNKTGILQTSLLKDSEHSETEEWKPIARSLYDGLIRPIEESGEFEEIERLAVVRSGILYDVPFAMLLREVEGKRRFLIEDYELVFPSSATTYVDGRDSKANSGLVTFGRNSNEGGRLKPLKNAESEARAVADVFSGSHFTGSDATETRFKRLALKHGFIHISAHAVANREMPLLSTILLGASETDDGNLTIREILKLRLNAELVTIAACEGARSFSPDPSMTTDIDRSALSDSFLSAGAKNVLASLAPASDQATSVLMKDFYSRLKTSRKATALANAQRNMLSGSAGREFSHPRYWSNFVLIGKGS